MEKVIPIGSWDFGVDPIEMVKMSRRGLHGQDREDFLTKRAGDHVFADMLYKISFADDELPVHALGIGATEAYGSNRNGDGFNEKICQARHHTFVSRPLSHVKEGEHGGARVYTHHNNKNPLKSYGYVKASAYNEKMRRIELLLAVNTKESAARRNGGLVLPEEYLEKLSNSELLPFSMACKLPYDVCAICHNKAAHRGEYCDNDTCIAEDGFRGFGCKHGLTKVADNGRQQYVENPGCTFFDFSIVGRPADRNAYGGVADYWQKAAVDSLIIGGAEMAEKFATEHKDDQSAGPLGAHALSLLNKLAYHEQQLENSPTRMDVESSRAFAAVPQADLRSLGAPGSEKIASAVRAMADRGVLPTMHDYVQLMQCFPADPVKCAEFSATISQYLPGAYSRLVAHPPNILLRMIDDAGLEKISRATPSREQRAFAEKLASSRSARPNEMIARAMSSAARGQAAGFSLPSLAQEKQASESRVVDVADQQLADRYALLKLAMICQVSETVDLPLTLRACVLQNYSR